MNILIADDHAVVRRSLRRLLEGQPGWNVCAETESGTAAVESARQLRPDVVLLDLTMPDVDGLEATRQIVRDVPGTTVLILTMNDCDDLNEEARRAGASGVVLKSEAGESLVSAIHSTLEKKRQL